MVHSPAEFIRRPKISTESATLGLDRMELGAFIACGEAGSPTDHAVACLLGLLGLRVSEACSIDVEDVGRPLLLARSGNRLNRHAATRIVRRLAKAAGITKHISPHSLRHTASSPPASTPASRSGTCRSPPVPGVLRDR